jgi:hypothetical protein
MFKPFFAMSPALPYIDLPKGLASAYFCKAAAFSEPCFKIPLSRDKLMASRKFYTRY